MTIKYHFCAFESEKNFFRYMQDRGNLPYEMSVQLNHKVVFFFYRIMRLCCVKRRKILNADRLDLENF